MRGYDTHLSADHLSIRSIAGLALLAQMLAIPRANAQRMDTVSRLVGPPVHRGEARLVPEGMLGEGKPSAEQSFTHPFVHLGGSGMVYVVDIFDPANVGDFRSTVRQYDSTGKFIRNIGRPGQGPGEYVGGIGDVVELPDGIIVISDGLGLLFYSPSGAPIRRSPARARSVNLGSRILLDPAGWICTYGATGLGFTRTPFIYRMKLDGRLVDSVAAPDVLFRPLTRVGLASLPFEPRDVAAWSFSGYFVTANTGRYALDVHSMLDKGKITSSACAVGREVTSIRRNAGVVAVQDGERTDWKASVEQFNEAQHTTPQWNGLSIPATKPPIRDISIDVSGRIWVRLSQPARKDVTVEMPPPSAGSDLAAARRWREPTIFDVFDASGRYLSAVRFPDGMRPGELNGRQFAARNDIVWAITYDDDDVPTVRRYRVVWTQ
jgi:hypothetical protein